jgi:NAD dependent epimerase/dehydratase family enzyme
MADLIQMFVSTIERPELTGVFNATAPAAVTNREFMRELRRALHRPWSPPVPAPFVRAGAWLMGSEGELALLSSRCAPRRFLEHGFQFQFPTLREAFANLYANK